MERTYNTFVDNGLFILSNKLNINIDNIEFKDIVNSTELMSNELEKFLLIANKIEWNTFLNSCYTQPLKGKSRQFMIYEQYKFILNNMGSDCNCSICGKRQVKYDQSNGEYNSLVSRSLMPLITSNSFMNYSNNLQTVNICPICLYLSMISILNMRNISRNMVLYLSDNNLFMENFTKYIKNKVYKELFEIEGKRKLSNEIYLREELLYFIQENMIGSGNYIKVINFTNGKNVECEELILSSESIYLLRELESKSLLDEFNNQGLFKLIINDNLKQLYQKYLIDFQKCELKCSVELYKFLNNKLNKLDNIQLDLIKNINSKLNAILNINILSELFNITNSKEMKEFLEFVILNYRKNMSKKIDISDDVINMFCNQRNFQEFKNEMVNQVILNSNMR